jgi:hypothetical protein
VRASWTSQQSVSNASRASKWATASADGAGATAATAEAVRVVVMPSTLRRYRWG